MKANSEQTWLTLLRQSSKSALQSIYDAYAERIFAISLQLLKDTGWSEDVVQEVFVKLWQYRNKLDRNSKLWPFLYVLTKRTCLNKLRAINQSFASTGQLWDTIAALGDCSHEKLVAKELNSHLENVLGSLPERQRVVFEMSRFEGFTHQEIAEKLNISPNTVKNHMMQALKIVRKLTLNLDY